MRAASEASLAAASDRWEPVLAATTDSAARRLGEDLFAVVDALDSSASLRRALTDPSRDGDSKAALAQGLLGGKTADDVADLVAGVVRSRWSSEADLPEALEELGTAAVLTAAQSRGELVRVEDEIFRFERTLATQRDLRVALGSVDLPAQRRTSVVEALLGEKVAPETALLIGRTVGALRQRSVTARLDRIAQLAAARRRRVVATVTAATPMTEAQVARLTDILARMYGTEVQVNVGIDPEVLGGLRVQIGADVVDATVAGKVFEARRRISG